MAKRQDHMLEALRASVGQDPTPSQAPSAGSRGDTPAPRAAALRPAPSARAGSESPANGPQGAPPSAQDSLTGSWVRPAEAPARASSPRRLPLGTTAFVGLQLVLLAAAFGVGWLAAGGELPRSGASASAAVEPTPLAQATFDLLPEAPRSSAARSQGGSRGTGASPQPPARAGASSPGTSGARTGGSSAVISGARTGGSSTVIPGARTDGSSTVIPGARTDGSSTVTSAADRALRDPANRYTVQVVQYPSTSSKHRGYAEDTFQRLLEAGLPACSPLEVEGALFLVVGAAPTTAALADLRKRLAVLPDPRTGRPMFNSPYEIRIDSLLRR
jgi:hypothetical protein